MIIADIENGITGNSNHLALTREIIKKSEIVWVITYEYWRKVGATTDCNCYVKRYIVLNPGTESESCYEDKTTVIQSVRAKKW